MRIAFSIAMGIAASTGCALAANDPCADYRRVLSYSRTADPTPVTLILDEEKTKAEIELRLPRSYTAIWGNLSDGRQCKISLELMWPDLAAGGSVPENRKRVRDRLIGDYPAWRALTIDVSIERSPALPWGTRWVLQRAGALGRNRRPTVRVTRIRRSVRLAPPSPKGWRLPFDARIGWLPA